MKTDRKLPADVTTALTQARALLDLLAENMEREAPLHNAQAFLIIAESYAKGELLEVREIAERLGISPSAVSRGLGALGEWSYKNRAGLQLIEDRTDYEDRRRKPKALTGEGEALAKKILNVFTRKHK